MVRVAGSQPIGTRCLWGQGWGFPLLALPASRDGGRKACRRKEEAERMSEKPRRILHLHHIHPCGAKSHSCVTRVIGQRLGGSVFARGDQVPDEALDVLITTVMQQAVSKEGPADGFNISLFQGPLEASVGQDVAPPSPTVRKAVTDTICIRSTDA